MTKLVVIALCFLIYTLFRSDFVDVEDYYLEDAQDLSNLVVYQNAANDLSATTYYLLYNYEDYSCIKVYDRELHLLSDDYIKSDDQISTMTIYNNYLFYAVNNTVYSKDLISGIQKSQQVSELDHIDQLYIHNNILYATDEAKGLALSNEEVEINFQADSHVYFTNGMLIAIGKDEAHAYELKNGKHKKKVSLNSNYNFDSDVDFANLQSLQLTDEYAIALYDNEIFYRNFYTENHFRPVSMSKDKIDALYTSDNQIFVLLLKKPILKHYQNRKEI